MAENLPPAEACGASRPAQDGFSDARRPLCAQRGPRWHERGLGLWGQSQRLAYLRPGAAHTPLRLNLTARGTRPLVTVPGGSRALSTGCCPGRHTVHPASAAPSSPPSPGPCPGPPSSGRTSPHQPHSRPLRTGFARPATPRAACGPGRRESTQAGQGTPAPSWLVDVRCRVCRLAVHSPGGPRRALATPPLTRARPPSRRTRARWPFAVTTAAELSGGLPGGPGASRTRSVFSLSVCFLIKSRSRVCSLESEEDEARPPEALDARFTRLPTGAADT